MNSQEQELYLPLDFVRDPDKTRWIYAISCNGCLKIGITDNVDKRLKSMMTGNPAPMKVELRRCINAACVRSAEATIHAALSDCRHQGEWFSVDIVRARRIIDTTVNAAKRQVLRYRERLFYETHEKVLLGERSIFVPAQYVRNIENSRT